MRVSILTPRLPPAVCGLADHTQLLAEAMTRQGVSVGFIHREPCHNGGRLPGCLTDHWSRGGAALERCLTRQGADWLWVQLSGYGYSRWGAPYALSRSLAWVRRRLPDLRLAVCLHETHCRPHQLGRKGFWLSRWQRHTVATIARLADVVFPIIPFFHQRAV